MNKKFDVIIIGAGPAGYVAAIRCAQLGLNTACIDEWLDKANQPSPGGTCLNVGCIPSKAMIDSSERYAATRNEYAAHGIVVKDVGLDLKAMLARKDQVVRDLTQGVAALFKANKVNFFAGRGRLLAGKQVEVREHGQDQPALIEANNIILAPGSVPTKLEAAPFDNEHVLDSTGALELDRVPKKLGIIGAGAIALELGSVWQRLGANVTLFKSRPGLLPAADHDVAKEALHRLTAQGLTFNMDIKITGCEVKNRKVHLAYETQDGPKNESFDKLIVAIGRAPNVNNLFTEDTGVRLDARGFIEVDEQCRTGVPGIYAIGDCVRGPMLAHKGSEEGIMVAELIAGHHAWVDLDTVPSVIYTDPEIAWVGKTEEDLKRAGIEYRVGRFPLSANGRARAIGHPHGFIKVIADARSDRILGVHIIGPQASELVMQAKIALDFKASSEDLAMTMFAHPTLSEALHEAALSVDGRAIHAFQPRKRR